MENSAILEKGLRTSFLPSCLVLSVSWAPIGVSVGEADWITTPVLTLGHVSPARPLDRQQICPCKFIKGWNPETRPCGERDDACPGLKRVTSFLLKRNHWLCLRRPFRGFGLVQRFSFGASKWCSSSFVG